MAVVRSPDFLPALNQRETALATLIHQRRLTPSCGGQAPTAERTVGPARMITESLTLKPGIREHNRSPKADIVAAFGHFRFVPIPDVTRSPKQVRPAIRIATKQSLPGDRAARRIFPSAVRWPRSSPGTEDKVRTLPLAVWRRGDGLFEAREGPAMKAIRIHGRGGPEQLVYEDAPKPVPQRGEALVRVMAAGVTPTELAWSSAYATRDKANRLPAIPGLNSPASSRRSYQGDRCQGRQESTHLLIFARRFRRRVHRHRRFRSRPQPRRSILPTAAIPRQPYRLQVCSITKLASARSVIHVPQARGTFAVQLANARCALINRFAANLPFSQHRATSDRLHNRSFRLFIVDSC